jgi:beta-glucuronidase
MLSPRQFSTRERTSLDGLWRFALDPHGAGQTERWWTSVLPGDREMPVPASFNDVVPSGGGAGPRGRRLLSAHGRRAAGT